jgi:hypothetical protein
MQKSPLHSPSHLMSMSFRAERSVERNPLIAVHYLFHSGLLTQYNSLGQYGFQQANTANLHSVANPKILWGQTETIAIFIEF